METFFDSKGRDRIILDWLKRNKPEFVLVYEYVLARFDYYRNYNALFLMAFEAGCEFAKASKNDRSTAVEYEYEDCSN